jgi:hemerythrin
MVVIDENQSLRANATEILHEHKGLVAMLNKLEAARSKGSEKDVLEDILVNLISHAATHFRTEERHFVELGYPDMERHRKEHAAFLRICAAFIEDFEQGKAALTTDVTCFLRDWWRGHVMGADKTYNQFLNDKRLN